MMYTRDTLKACEGINGWEIAASFAVGGYFVLSYDGGIVILKKVNVQK